MESAVIILALAVGVLGTLTVLLLRKGVQTDRREVSVNLVLPEEFRFVHRTVAESENSKLDKGLSKDNNVSGDYRVEWEAVLNKLDNENLKQSFLDDDEAYFRVKGTVRPIDKDKYLEMKTLHEFTSKGK